MVLYYNTTYAKILHGATASSQKLTRINPLIVLILKLQITPARPNSTSTSLGRHTPQGGRGAGHGAAILQGGDMELNSGELLSSYIKTLTDEVAKTVREENKVLKNRIDDMQKAIDRIKQ